MIRLDKVCARHGKQVLLVDVSMAIFVGEKVGLVGPNGSGKSTIFRMIVGEEAPDGGAVVVDRGVTIGYFSQDVGEMAGRTVVEEVMAGAGEVSEVGAELAELEEAMADPQRADELEALVDRFGTVQARFDALDGYTLEARAREILAGLSFRAAAVDRDVAELSGGWKMRVALARILLMRPDALLLDEPTNHLDLESIIWLEKFLHEFPGGVVVTSHDRAFLNRLVTRIVEIDAGELRSFSGDYDFYVQQRDLLAEQAEAQFARQQAMLAKEKSFIERFKARASHAAQVQSREKKLDKIDLVAPPVRRRVVAFEFRQPPNSSGDVANLVGVHKRYGDHVVYQGLDLLLRRGERWCVMGVNGAGKSTLLKLIAGESTPDEGTVTIGPSVKMGYFAQHAMELLSPQATVFDTLQDAFPVASIGSIRSLAGAFGFSGDDVDKPCRILSGGEKARVVLARMLYDPPNFLVLDEPTNHLDMETKDMLVRSLSGFKGTMLFVSHDRRFLAALSNRVLELRGCGDRSSSGAAVIARARGQVGPSSSSGVGGAKPDGVHQYGGGYTEYIAQSGHEAPGVA